MLVRACIKGGSEIIAAVRACTCRTYLSVSDRRAAGDIVPRRCRGLRGIQGLGVPPTDHPKQSATHRGLQAELMRQVERQTLTSQCVISRRRRRQGAGLRRLTRSGRGRGSHCRGRFYQQNVSRYFHPVAIRLENTAVCVIHTIVIRRFSGLLCSSFLFEARAFTF